MNLSYQDVVRFHGHECPGLSLGMRAAELAVSRLGRHEPGNELVAVTETDACAVDAIQLLTGCTYGKRNLVHRDHGKVIFSFWRRSDGAGVRVRARAGTDAYRDELTQTLAGRIDDGTATPDERARFAELQAARVQRILAAPVETILTVEELDAPAPEPKPVGPNAPCEGCGDLTASGILHHHRGRMLCPPCHLDAHGGVLPPDHAHDGHPHGGHSHGHDHAHSH
jgi:formylmethanofuran dehydrogenase subunit E